MLGRIRPLLGDEAQVRPQNGPNRSNVGQHPPRLVKVKPTLGRCLLKLAKIRQNLGRHRPKKQQFTDGDQTGSTLAKQLDQTRLDFAKFGTNLDSQSNFATTVRQLVYNRGARRNRVV